MKSQKVLVLIFCIAAISQDAAAINWPSWLNRFFGKQARVQNAQPAPDLSESTSNQPKQNLPVQASGMAETWARPELEELIQPEKLNESYRTLFGALKQGLSDYRSQYSGQSQGGLHIDLQEMVNDSFFDLYDSIYTMNPLDFEAAAEKIGSLEGLLRASRYMAYEYVSVWSGATAQLTFWRERNVGLRTMHPLPPKFEKPVIPPNADQVFANLRMSNSQLLGSIYKSFDESLSEILRGMTAAEELGFLRSIAFSDEYYNSHPQNRFESVPGLRELLVANNEWSHFIGATRVAAANHLMEIDTQESWQEVFRMFFGDNISTPNGGVIYELQDLLAEYMTYYKRSNWNKLLPSFKDPQSIKKVLGRVDQWKINQGLGHISAAVDQASKNVDRMLGIVRCEDVI